MDLGLTGKVALVTGGSDGIGKAAAAAFVAEGANVVICARRVDVLEAAGVEIGAAGPGDVLAIPCDVSDEAQVQAMVQQAVDRWGRLDILVNNAGTSAAAKFEDVTNEIWHADLQLKLYGAIYCTRAALPHLKAADGGGRVVNITTHGGKAPAAGSLPTSAARAAGLALTKAMSRDYASDGIRVNTVCIGLIKSGQIHRRFETMRAGDSSLTEDLYYQRLGERIPLGRVGEASEAGDVICFLASDRAGYLTGTAVNIDGGASPVV